MKLTGARPDRAVLIFFGLMAMSLAGLLPPPIPHARYRAQRFHCRQPPDAESVGKRVDSTTQNSNARFTSDSACCEWARRRAYIP